MLADKLRNAVVRHCPQPVPEWVSGHTADGRPSQKPHLAFLPLPFVGSEHADGHLLGLSMAIPKLIDHAEVGRCLNPVLGFGEDGSRRRVHLYDGANFDWHLGMEGGGFAPGGPAFSGMDPAGPALGNRHSHRLRPPPQGRGERGPGGGDGGRSLRKDWPAPSRGCGAQSGEPSPGGSPQPGIPRCAAQVRPGAVSSTNMR